MHYLCFMNPVLFFRKTGSGKPVIIIHGLFGMSDNWHSFARQLGESGFEVYTVDLRNHGHSFHSGEFSIASMSTDLVRLMEAENIRDPVIGGHSLGGKVAMHLALHHPELISRLIVMDIAPRFYPVHHLPVINALKAVDLVHHPSRKEAEHTLALHQLDMATRQFLLKNLYHREKQLAWRFNLEAIEKNIGEAGREILAEKPFTKPALFIAGEYSSYITKEDQIAIPELFPEALIRQAPRSGHWIHADNPAWLLSAMIAFIRE